MFDFAENILNLKHYTFVPRKWMKIMEIAWIQNIIGDGAASLVY